MMSEFEDKLKEQFKNWKLKISSNHRPKNSIYLYVDFVELMALFSNGSTISDSDVFERFKEDEIIRYKSSHDTIEDNDSTRAGRNDDDWEFVTDIFELVRLRSDSFSDMYPFEFDFQDNIFSLKLKGNINIIRKIYLNLLICSNLDSFPKLKHILSAEFESLSKEVIKSLLKGWQVLSTGKNPEINGDALTKIKKLEKLLRIDINSRYVSENLITGNQEYGLDLIAWKDFNDSVANKLILLIQCTCEKEWFKKTNDTRSWENFYYYQKIKPYHSLVVPYDLIDGNTNNFFDLNKIKDNDVLIIDRQRIMNEINNIELEFYNILISKKIINKCIETQESLV
jgi:hypothetical protein